MRTAKFLKSVAVAVGVGLFAVSIAYADHDGRDGNSNGGNNGNRGFSGGNVSNNAGNSGNSNRSFSGSTRTIVKPSDGSGTTRTFQNQGGNNPSNEAFKNFQGQHQVFRPADDNVRDFLKLKNDNDARYNARNPKDREFVDRQFKDWNNIWSGQKGDGKDHRDWSGSWKGSDRFSVADRIRNDWHKRRSNDLAFSDAWWKSKHHGNSWGWWGDYAVRYHRPWYWWSCATGPRLGAWLTFGWPSPYYWDYGPGEYIYCDNGAIFVNGRWYEPAPVFYAQTAQLIDQAPLLAPEAAANLEWMPLGVFAVTPDGVAEPSVTVQLAVTKDGLIGGNAFDPKTNATYNIRGIVDRRSQRAVWSYTDDQNKRVMMETSAYNLTQPEATGLVHYSPTDMRVVELVRLQDPSAGGQPGAPVNAGPTLPAPVSR